MEGGPTALPAHDEPSVIGATVAQQREEVLGKYTGDLDEVTRITLHEE